jgi:hypothetical protein
MQMSSLVTKHGYLLKSQNENSKTRFALQEGPSVYYIFSITQGPAIQFAVPKGKSVNAKFYKKKGSFKTKEYF